MPNRENGTPRRVLDAGGEEGAGVDGLGGAKTGEGRPGISTSGRMLGCGGTYGAGLVRTRASGTAGRGPRSFGRRGGPLGWRGGGRGDLWPGGKTISSGDVGDGNNIPPGMAIQGLMTNQGNLVGRLPGIASGVFGGTRRRTGGFGFGGARLGRRAGRVRRCGDGAAPEKPINPSSAIRPRE